MEYTVAYPLGTGNRVIAKDVKSCTYYCYVICTTLIVRVGMPGLQTGVTHYHALLGLYGMGLLTSARYVV